MQIEGWPVDLIVIPQVLEWIRANVPETYAWLASESTTDDRRYWYPDGSIHVCSTALHTERLWHVLHELRKIDGLRPEKNYFRGLAPFGRTMYFLWYTEEYRNKTPGETGFLTIPGPLHVHTPEEGELSRLLVTVPFVRKPSKKTIAAFSDFLRAWLQSVASRGLFGEGPVSLAEAAISIRGRIAQFYLDVSQSGQFTVNWLTVSLLDFGYRVALLRGVQYDTQHLPLYPGQNFVDLFWEVGPEEPVSVELPGMDATGNSAEKVAASTEEAESPPWPGSATPHPTLSSKDFPILQMPASSWEELHVNVLFADRANAEQREAYTRLVDCWLTLGQYGGFGGKGIRAAGKAEFTNSAEQVTFWADMGDAEEATALRVLVGALAGFHQLGLPINAVVFGRMN